MSAGPGGGAAGGGGPAGLGGAGVAPAPDGAGERAFRFDPNRCTGCRACELACAVENDLPWDASWRQVLHFNPERAPGLPGFHLSLACNHCDDAPCMRHCPALAYRRDAATGVVLVEADRCIGCRYCAWACPFDAPRFDAAAGTMAKCTFCAPRLAEGKEPACAAICPTGALDTGARLPAGGAPGGGGAAGEAAMPGFPETSYGPAIRFEPLRGDAPSPFPGSYAAPAAPAAPGSGGAAAGAARRPGGAGGSARSGAVAGPGAGATPGIGLRGEWPLAVFTFGFALLVAWLTAALARPGVWREVTAPLLSPVGPWLFGGAAALLFASSASHLGRPARAWRAVLNQKGSWLSREIVLAGAFAATGVAVLALEPASPWPGRAATLLGFAALFAMDRVYDVLERPGPSRGHSADVLLTGGLVAWLLMGGGPIAMVFLGVKAALYVLQRRGGPRRAGWTALRAGGLVAGALLGMGSPVAWWAPLLALALAGEATDRAEFYLDLRRRTPARELERHRARLPAL